MKYFAIFIISSGLLLAAPGRVLSGPETLYNYSMELYNNGEYYNAISELKRFRFLYPRNDLYSDSQLLMAQAYYKGNNYETADRIFTECFKRYRTQKTGERALFYLGNIRLISGSPVYALQTYYNYCDTYADGMYKERVGLQICYAKSLSGDFSEARSQVRRYIMTVKDAGLADEARELDRMLLEEINRPKKSVAVSVIGSVFIPGFGHAYTGDYSTGILSFLSNVLFMYMIYDGYRSNDQFQMIFFSFIELSFYQYSLYSAARNVYEYNSPENLHKNIRLRLQHPF